MGGAGDKYRFHLDPIAIERKQTPAWAAVGLGFGPTTDYSALCLSSFLLRFFADFRASLLRATVFLRLELTLVLCGSFYDGKIWTRWKLLLSTVPLHLIKVYGNEDCGINEDSYPQRLMSGGVSGLLTKLKILLVNLFFLILVQKILYKKIRRHLGDRRKI